MNTPPQSRFDRIEISLDGSHACALLGPNLQEGEAEFAPIEGWPNATSKQEYAAMSAAYEALAKRIGDRPPFDIVREHTSASETQPPITDNDRRWRFLEHGCQWVSFIPIGGEQRSFDPRVVTDSPGVGVVAMRVCVDGWTEKHLAILKEGINAAKR